MPAYDYRCTACGLVIELVHRMSETIEARDHLDPATGAACAGELERLISAPGFAKNAGTKPPSDAELRSAGFTKYVRGSKGYEKVFGGPDTPSVIDRD